MSKRKSPTHNRKIRGKQKRIKRYLKRSGKELKKNIPDLEKILRLQQKSAKLLQEIANETEKRDPGQSTDNEKKKKKKKKNRKKNSNEQQTLTYSLEKISEKDVKKFGSTSCAYRVKVSRPDSSLKNPIKDHLFALENVFDSAIQQVKEKCNLTDTKRDRMRIIVNSNHFKKPLSTRLVRVQEQTASLILNEISKVLQSQEEIPLDESFNIDVLALKMPVGKTRGIKVLDFAKDNKLKKSILTIRNSDNLCCSRAIVTARELALKGPKLTQLMRGRPIQKRLALELHKLANVPPGACGLQEIDRFQKVLTDFQIIVISFSNRNNVIYQGPLRDKKIILYNHNTHFDVIKPNKLPAFFGYNFYCNVCKKYYNDIRYHPCRNFCHVCKKKTCTPTTTAIQCQKCNKVCRSQKCLEEHQKVNVKSGFSNCDQSFRCTECNSIVDAKRKTVHVCNEFKCWNCKAFVLPGHLCYIQHDDPKPPSDKLLFFDFETDQSSGEHIVNFAVAQDITGKTSVFRGYDALDRFCKYVFSKQFNGYTCIAHNGKSFDNCFVLRWLLENRPTAGVHIIRTGLKIMHLSVKDYKIRFIDSINFFQMPLAKLPKTFGLDQTKMLKGFFPHLFNKKENFGYIGKIPDAKYYCPESMTPDARAEFMAWHEELLNKNYVFDFNKELEQYCIQDVNILRESCIRFRELFLSETNVDPFSYVTIASCAMGVYKSAFLQPNTIGVVPNDLYKGVHKNYSKSAIQWLEFVQFSTNTRILHALNGGEHKIFDKELGKTYFVDGFSPESKQVYEFLGCFHHGHIECFDQNTDHVLIKNKKNSEIYQETLDRLNRIKQLGYTVKYIWSCHFEKLTQTTAFKEFIQSFEIVYDAEPREAFYGGRVNGIKLYHVCKPDEKIKYVDFTSLYPFVNRSKQYPIGHPKIIREDFGDLRQYFGIVHCKVVAPAGLYLPVLPAKISGKLVFPLCKQCAINNDSLCRHSENERGFYGFWCTPELHRALDLGYKVLDIKSVWSFENSSNTLFESYVKTFLKLKQESSGFPDSVKTPRDREQYVADYFAHEGIQLSLDKIKKNPGLRAISKLILNSLWGKFGQAQNKEQSELVFEATRFYEVINSADCDVLDLHLINQDIIEVVYKQKEQVVKESNIANIFIAIFTTAWARLELYDLINKLDRRVLYMDTDSCIYVSKEGEFEPELSSYLGGLTNEVADSGNGEYITEFVTCGPKNYAYKISNGECVVKVKGFRLNYRTSKLINMDTMKSLVRDMKDNKTITVVNEHKITREPITSKLINKREEKKYQLVYDKRMIVGEGPETLPYGYFWEPNTTISQPSQKKAHDNIPSELLYSNNATTCVEPELDPLFPYNDENHDNENASDEGIEEFSDHDGSINIMDTSDSDSEEDEYTMEDLAFYDDTIVHDEVSFYRALDNGQ